MLQTGNVFTREFPIIQRILQDFWQFHWPSRGCLSTIDNLPDMMKLQMTRFINYQTELIFKMHFLLNLNPVNRLQLTTDMFWYKWINVFRDNTYIVYFRLFSSQTEIKYSMYFHLQIFPWQISAKRQNTLLSKWVL